MKPKTKFKQTEIGEIPEDWEVKSISEVSDIFLGGTPRTNIKEYWDGDIKWALAKDISDCSSRYIIKTEKKISQKGVENSAAKILPKNTIVITSRGTVGKMALLPEPMCFNQTCYGLKTKQDNDSLFLYYKLIYSLKKIMSISYGTVFNTITMRTFDELKESFPNKKKQELISGILDSLDSKIEINNKMNKILEAIGQAIFKRWFIDFEFPNEEGKPYKSSGGKMIDSELGKIPKGWRVSKIGEELKTVLGGTPSTTNKSYWENGTIPWINSGAINDFPIVNASQHITEAGLNNSATQLMPKKTVVLPFVISINKDIRISITGIETSGNQSVLGIVENEKIPCEFIYYWVEKMKDDIYSWATGGAQQHINKNNVDNTLILIPNNNVINNFKKLLIPIFDKILNNSYEIQTLSKIRDSLLPKLMSGKIRVK